MEYYKNLSLESISYVNKEGFKSIEIWKRLDMYDNVYFISDLGRVKNDKRIKKQTICNKKYLYTMLRMGGKNKYTPIHQLVAMAFLNHNPCGHKIVVDHINNIPTDNSLHNIQTITHRENTSKDKKNKNKYIGVKASSKREGFWESSISINGKRIHLCHVNNVKLANKYYIIALDNLHLFKGVPSDFRELIRVLL